jgi:RNA polymerase primary sigma factor
MNRQQPTAELTRFAIFDCSETEVLTPRHERLLLQELAECKLKLSDAFAGIEGLEISADAGPQATAQFITAAFSSKGPEQARLGAVYRRYCELRGKLALCNLKLVAHVAKRFRTRGIPYSDLLQEGFCSLLEAIDRFDMSHETKLATYATWWIRQSMQRAVASSAYPVRLTPRHLRQLAQNQAPDHHQQLGAKEQRTLDIKALPKNDLINRIHTATRPTISLNTTYDSSSNFSLIQTIGDPDADRTLDIDTDETIEKLMQLLRPREQEVLALRFGLGGRERLSLTQVGKILEVSKERVRQIEEKALKKLRASVAQQSAAKDRVFRF